MSPVLAQMPMQRTSEEQNIRRYDIVYTLCDMESGKLLSLVYLHFENSLNTRKVVSVQFQNLEKISEAC